MGDEDHIVDVTMKAITPKLYCFIYREDVEEIEQPLRRYIVQAAMAHGWQPPTTTTIAPQPAPTDPPTTASQHAPAPPTTLMRELCPYHKRQSPSLLP